jgi:hypothetical protein
LSLFQNFNLWESNLKFQVKIGFWGGPVRNLVLILIAFIAVITFIRVLDAGEPGGVNGTVPDTIIEIDAGG